MGQHLHCTSGCVLAFPGGRWVIVVLGGQCAGDSAPPPPQTCVWGVRLCKGRQVVHMRPPQTTARVRGRHDTPEQQVIGVWGLGQSESGL